MMVIVFVCFTDAALLYQIWYLMLASIIQISNPRTFPGADLAFLIKGGPNAEIFLSGPRKGKNIERSKILAKKS